MSTETPIKLILSTENKRINDFVFREDLISIGRAPENQIVLNEATISQYHAIIINNDRGIYKLIDLSSSSGTYLNKKKLTANQAEILNNGDTIEIVGYKIEFTRQVKSDLEQKKISTKSIKVDIYNSDSEVNKLSNSGQEKTIDLKKIDSITIGRDPNNDLAIDHPLICRYHAKIQRKNNSFYIFDLSKKGILINSKPLKSKRILKVNDRIRIGPYTLILNINEQLTEYNEQGNLRLDAVNLNQVVNNNLNLLNNISVSFAPRKFIVIAGVSGGGKSTLLNALTGFQPATSGQVLVNGTNLYRNFDTYRAQIGYVPQKDIVHMELTVFEALNYAAQLRMPADTTLQERRERIEEVLEELNLNHRKHLQIKALSGGQLKRVSMGVELLTKPSLFFLDEATSGLDPGTEADIMLLLRQLANSGCTIVLITHATENVILCDLVLFLAKGGHLAYFGPPQNASAYFEVTKFNEIYHRVEREKSPKEWQKQYLKSPYYQKYVFQPLASLLKTSKFTSNRKISIQSPTTKTMSGNAWRQFIILSKRNISILTRDRGSLFLMLAIAPILGMLDFITWQNKLFDPYYGNAQQAITMLFTLSLIAVLVGSLTSMREIVKEREIYRRERSVGLKVFPYIFSKVWVCILLALYQGAIFLFFKLITVDISHSFQTLIGLYFTLFLTSLAGGVMGLLVSTISPHQNIAPLLTIVFLVPQITYAGGIIPANSFGAPGQILNKIALTKWSFESLVTISDLGKDIAQDPCWSLSEKERKNLSKKQKEKCPCSGKNLFKLCNFPEIKNKYDPALDLPEPKKPKKPPNLPNPPQQPPRGASFPTIKKYLLALENYQTTVKEYQKQVDKYQEQISDWEQEYSEWKSKNDTAISEAEGIINKYYQDYGNTFAVNLAKNLSILFILIIVMLSLICILQKSKDLI